MNKKAEQGIGKKEIEKEIIERRERKIKQTKKKLINERNEIK